MFSEYLNMEKPLDSMAKKDEKGLHNHEKKDKFNDKNSPEGKLKDKNKELALSDAKNQISKRVSHLTLDDPNDLNPKEKQYTFGSAFSESMKSGIGQINEKKIPGFERTLSDGCKAKVTCSDNQFSLNITKEEADGKSENLRITFTHFKDGQDSVSKNGVKSPFQMSVIGNIKLLDESLQNSNDIVTIVNSIEKNVMKNERQNVHAAMAKQIETNRERFENKLKEYELLLMEMRDLMLNPPVDNKAIAECLIDSDKQNFPNGEYLSARKTFLALCILLQSINNFQEIKKMIGNQEDNVQRAANTKSIEDGEHILEYLTNNRTDLQFLIYNESKIIALASQSSYIPPEYKIFLDF